MHPPNTNRGTLVIVDFMHHCDILEQEKSTVGQRRDECFWRQMWIMGGHPTQSEYASGTSAGQDPVGGKNEKNRGRISRKVLKIIYIRTSLSKQPSLLSMQYAGEWGNAQQSDNPLELHGKGFSFPLEEN